MVKRLINNDNGSAPHRNPRPSRLCAAVCEGGARKRDQSISFRALQRDPDTFKGRWVMLAGVIIEARNTKEGTSIEVLQRPMDRWGSRMKRMP